METKQESRPLDVLRWIIFLPAAALASWLSWYVVQIVDRFSSGYVGIGPEDLLGQFYFITAGHAAVGATLVYIGTMVAPSHRVKVAFILGGIGVIMVGFLLFPALMIRDWWNVWGSIVMGIGAGGVVYFMHAVAFDAPA